MTHATMKNAQGETINHDSAGRAKDYETWKKLDDDAYRKKGQEPPIRSDPRGSSPNIDALKQTYGIQPGGSGASDDDPPVFITNQVEDSDAWGSRMLDVPDQTKPFSDYLDDFYELGDAEFRKVQQRAFDAGLYGADADAEDVPWGDRSDEVALKLWAEMGRRSAANYKAGKKVSPWAALETVKPTGEAKKKKTVAPFQPELLDPAEMRAALREKAPEKMGRYLDDAEAEQIIALYNDASLAVQRKRFEMSGSGDPENPGVAGTLPTMPSFDTFAEEEIRRRRPEETFAKDVNNRYQEFLDLLGAG